MKSGTSQKKKPKAVGLSMNDYTPDFIISDVQPHEIKG
jgi:hypothetical protein